MSSHDLMTIRAYELSPSPIYATIGAEVIMVVNDGSTFTPYATFRIVANRAFPILRHTHPLPAKWALKEIITFHINSPSLFNSSRMATVRTKCNAVGRVFLPAFRTVIFVDVVFNS